MRPLLCVLALALLAAAVGAETYEYDYSYGDSYDLDGLDYSDEYGYLGNDDDAYYEEYGVYTDMDEFGYDYNDYYEDYLDDGSGSTSSSCTTDKDGNVKLGNGTVTCDLRLSGADHAADLLTGGLDGIYTLSGCHNGRAMYKRKDSPAGEERLLWYAKSFHDWDLSRGSEPPTNEKEGDILLFGQDPNQHGVPLFVQSWSIGADLTSDKPNGTKEDVYIPISIELGCADGQEVTEPDVTPAQQRAGPILTDDEMEQKYKLIYEKYGRRPEPNPNVNFSFVIMLVMIGLTVVLAIPYMLVNRSRTGGKGYQPVATSFAQVIQQSKKKQSGHIH